MTKNKLRRYLILTLLMVFTTIGVIACNHTSNPSISSNTQCEIITHPLGETCIPKEVKRLVVIDYPTLESAIALGIKPVGIATRVAMWGTPFPDYLQSEVTGIEVIGDENQPNLEKILQLQPDLILAADWLGGIYPQLSAIAPTAIMDWQLKQNMANYLKFIAKILNRDQEAETLLNNYQQRIAEFRAKMGDKLNQTNVSIIQFGFDRLRLTTESMFAGQILADAGLPPVLPENLKDEGGTVDISLELIPKINSDVIFLFNTRAQAEKQLLEKYQRHPLWSKLKAVQTEQVYPVDSEYWMFGNIFAAHHIIDDLFKYLIQ